MHLRYYPLKVSLKLFLPVRFLNHMRIDCSPFYSTVCLLVRLCVEPPSSRAEQLYLINAGSFCCSLPAIVRIAAACNVA